MTDECDSTAVACALRDIADRLDDRPSAFEWLTVFWLPLSVGLLTLLVAGLTAWIAWRSWKTSNAATTIAEAALRREQEQDAAASGKELDARLAELIIALAQLGDDWALWVREAEDLESTSSPGMNPDDLPYPPQPAGGTVLARLEVGLRTLRHDDVRLERRCREVSLDHEPPLGEAAVRLPRLVRPDKEPVQPGSMAHAEHGLAGQPAALQLELVI